MVKYYHAQSRLEFVLLVMHTCGCHLSIFFMVFEHRRRLLLRVELAIIKSLLLILFLLVRVEEGMVSPL